MINIPPDIKTKITERENLRKQGDYKGADAIRQELSKLGFVLVDQSDGTTELKPQESRRENVLIGPGKIAVFGSGEMSSVGRSIHELMIKDIPPPVKISLLETPTGYEDNPHHWYKKLQAKMEQGLVDYKPQISLVPALRSEGAASTNDQHILEPLLTADYIHTGAGSPTYAVKHLKDSLALRYLKDRLVAGVPVSVASAAAIAFSRYTLPVYEIYFAGHDPSWISGLDFFADWGLNLTFIPHWNNREGGAEIDTRFAYMGEKRFNKLLSILPGQTTIIGIEEHTGLIFDLKENNIQVVGKGSAIAIEDHREIKLQKGEYYNFEFEVKTSSINI